MKIHIFADTGKYNNYELTEADIEVSYENNIEKGTATITVTGKGNMSGSVELTFEIGDSDLEKVAAARGELEALYGDVLTGTLAEAPATLPLVTENGCEVMWSSNSTALSVNELGEVTILATSEAQAVVLVATIESGNAFEQTTFEFTVPAKSAETTWNLVTDASTLKVGDKIVIVASTVNVALSTVQESTYRGTTAVERTDKSITINESVEIIVLEAGTVEGTYALKTTKGEQNGYLCSVSAKKLTTESDKCNWTITISDEIASIVTKAISNNALQYNTGSPRFTTYTSSQQKVKIYRETAK